MIKAPNRVTIGGLAVAGRAESVHARPLAPPSGARASPTSPTTGPRPTALLVNSADYPNLSAKAAVGPGDTIAEAVVRFNGVPLVVNDAITAGLVWPSTGWRSAHGTDVLFASLPNLTNNTILPRAETYFALLQHDAGAIVAVDLAA